LFVQRKLWRLSLALAILALVAVACGGGTTAGSGNNTKPDVSGKIFGGAAARGGVMKMDSVGDVDYMDPGQAYAVQYFDTVGRGTIRTLVSYPNTSDLNRQIKPVPDLATALGQHNANSTVWTYHLKPGLKYGPAIGGNSIPGVTGQAITTPDIKYAIERLFNPSVGNGYATYYKNIKGAPACKSYGCNIQGIETPNATTIVFHLTKPTGDWDLRMTMPGTAPVPQRYASTWDKTKDSDYEGHVLAQGPYYVAQYTPGEQIIMKRNPDWDPATDNIRKAYVDELDWKEGFDNSVCVAKVLSGDYDLSAGDCLPGGPQLQKITSDPTLKQRFFNGPQPCTSYIFMNTRIKPFNKLKVRQAVNYLIDKDNLRRLAGGPLVGKIASSVLPPGMVGFLPTSQYDPFHSDNFSGDVAKAKQLMKEAGYPNGYGKADGPPLLLVGSSTDPGPKQVESVKQDLAKVGITNLQVKELQYPDYYTQYYAEPSSNTAIGFAGWCEDFPSPDTFLTPLLYGPNILPHGNSNYSETNDPALNKSIEKAQAASPAEAPAAWAAANKKATESASWVPYRWTYGQIVVGPNITHAFYNQYYELIDWVNSGVEH
jgi:peptide/nickel transport system substrate-binding protein